MLGSRLVMAPGILGGHVDIKAVMSMMLERAHAQATAGELGIPTIVLGPGDSNCHAHGTDEYCPVEELIRACEVYVQLCASL